jgi:tetratricopeptide (TPR) repeat protein
MRTNNHKLKLADYLYQDLDAGESLEFENKISEDPELHETYHLNVKVRDYLKAKIRLEEMRSDPMLGEAEKLAELAFQKDPPAGEPKHPGSASGKVLRTRLMYIPAVAAIYIILLAIRLFIPANMPDILFENFYRPLPAADYIQRGEAGVNLSDLSEGIALYNQGAYEESIRVLDRAGSVQGGLPEADLFRGLDYLGLEQYETARDILAEYTENNTGHLPEALWYLSLCYLKTGEYAKSRALITRLEAYDGIYKRNAHVLERKLRRIK